MRKILFLLALVACVGCESPNDSVFSPQIVIQGFLYANEPVDSIVLRTSLPLNASSNNDRLSGATVTISTPDTSFVLHEDLNAPTKGRYIMDGVVLVQPGKTYTLKVEALGQTAISSTTVPLPIHLDSVKLGSRMLSLTSVDTIVYPTTVADLSSPGIQQWWSPSPGSAGYGLEALTLDTLADTIVDRATKGLADSAALGRYRFFILSNSEQVVWIQFKFYGLNLIRALALDRNYQDFVLGLYLSGSQFNNQTLHVAGGLGVFGSAARTRKEVFLK